MRVWRWSMLSIVILLLLVAFVAPLMVIMLRGLAPLDADAHALIG